MASQAEIADWLGVTQPAVADMVRRGVISPAPRGGHDLRTAVREVLAHLRAQAAGRTSNDQALDLPAERARLAAAQADAQESKNAQARGELLLRADVTKTVHAAFARVRSKVLSLPARAAPLIASMRTPTEVQAKLTELVHEALAELAATSVVANDSADPSGGGDGDGVVAGDGPPAETDRKPVGRSKAKAQPRGKRRAGAVGHKSR